MVISIQHRKLIANGAWATGVLLAVAGGIVLSTGSYWGRYLIVAAVPLAAIAGNVAHRLPKKAKRKVNAT
jgi:hypothetical protein